jgi:hypothetical protein
LADPEGTILSRLPGALAIVGVGDFAFSVLRPAGGVIRSAVDTLVKPDTPPAGTQVKIIGFRGTGFRDPTYVNEHPLIRAGHVGISFDDGATVYGFQPSEAAARQYGDDLLSVLRDNVSVEGQVFDDTLTFLRANELASRGARTRVYEMSIDVGHEEFARIQASVAAQLDNPALTQTRYMFPPRTPEGLPMSMPPGCANCATFPRELGIPIPEETGQLSRYIDELKQLGTLWQHKPY